MGKSVAKKFKMRIAWHQFMSLLTGLRNITRFFLRVSKKIRENFCLQAKKVDFILIDKCH
jgi:hypothetical protein